MEKQKTPYLSEVDWAILLFILVFLGMIGGIRAYTYFTRQVDPNTLTKTLPENAVDLSQVGSDIETPTKNVDNATDIVKTPEWTYFTEEIEIRGDQLVCKEYGEFKYEIFNISQCQGLVEIEEKNTFKKRFWLEFPNRKRVLWENEKLKEAFEKNASKEVLYQLDYAKYSGNVKDGEENK
ncbi:MAG: hypothetical protein AABZ60_22610 [Planctomycetota bacterium]